MRNKEVAELLRNMGTLLEIKGEMVFKVRAYFRAADNIESLGEDIETVKDEGRLSDIPGVGKTLEAKIKEFLDTGKLKAYKELTKEVPETLLEVVHTPSIGPKKAKLFFDELKVKDLDDLKKAAEGGKLEGLEGIKARSIEKILDGIRVVRQGQERMNLGLATKVAEDFAGALEKRQEVKGVYLAGSLRRGRETVRDIDILVDSKDAKKTMDAFVRLPRVKSVNSHGETKSSIVDENNVQVDVRIVDPESLGAAWLYFTGSKNFNIKLRQIAIKQKKKISEYGVFSTKGKKEKCLAQKTEKDCFKALGLPFVPPELREDIGEERIFGGKKIPALIEEKDIKGEFHVHSTWSDGKHSIEDMARAAKEKGYEYLAVSDHSQGLRIANGVSPEDLKKKKKEIDRVNKKLKGFTVLFGTELEIDKDGRLDYNDKILAEFDIVIASIHSGFKQSREQLTERLIKACQNKYVNIIGHPTGVHLGKREPYDIDLKEVCRAARDHNVFLEINAFPVRLDLNGANAYYAREQGVKFCINTDAHHVDHLGHMRFGVSMARRAWLTKKDVLNTRTWAGVEKAIKK